MTQKHRKMPKCPKTRDQHRRRHWKEPRDSHGCRVCGDLSIDRDTRLCELHDSVEERTIAVQQAFAPSHLKKAQS